MHSIWKDATPLNRTENNLDKKTQSLGSESPLKNHGAAIYIPNSIYAVSALPQHNVPRAVASFELACAILCLRLLIALFVLYTIVIGCMHKDKTNVVVILAIGTVASNIFCASILGFITSKQIYFFVYFLYTNCLFLIGSVVQTKLLWTLFCGYAFAQLFMISLFNFMRVLASQE